MKKLLTAIVLLALTLSLTACAKAPVSNGLMADASPSTSALALYCYDGKTVTLSYLFDTPEIRAMFAELDAVKAVKADNWSLNDITLPVYGLNIGKTDGFGLFAAWSNGYWITQTGDAYKFDFDFAAMLEKHPGTDKRNHDGFTIFPNAYYLTKDENGWSDTLLTAAAEPSPPENITITLTSWDNERVVVEFENHGEAEWMFGEYFHLEVLLNGKWYAIPATSNNWGFNDIGYILNPGQTRVKDYNLTMYGDLPPATYRLVAFDLSVEHTVT